jgi:hypothetical protein
MKWTIGRWSKPAPVWRIERFSWTAGDGPSCRRRRMTNRGTVFADSVSAMLKLAQSDPEQARVALVARGDQVLAALRESLLPAAKESERVVALIDLYLQATFEMLFEAARSDDRIEFGEAEIKAWEVADVLDRGAEGAKNGDREALLASMRAAESILGIAA